MKQLVFILLLSSNFVFGQHSRDTRVLSSDKEIFHILRKQQLVGELKPTGLKQRVRAQSFTDGINTDSTTFKYSGMHGSRFDFNSYYYDNVLENTIEPNAFSILADSISSFVNDTLSYLDYSYYGADNKTDSLFSIFSGSVYELDSTKLINVYDANGVASHSYYFLYDTVTNDTTALFQYNYNNTQTKKITDTIWGKESGSWFFGSTIQYHYDALGNLDTLTQWGLISSTLTMTARSVFTYYPDGKLRTRLTNNYFDGTFFISASDTFGYTSGIEYCTSWQTVRTTDFGTGPQITYSLILKYPGMNGNPDSTKQFTKATPNGTWIPQHVYRYTYNSYNNPEEILLFLSENNTGIPDQRSRFYYEIYDDGLAIDERRSDNDLTVYPNPFSNQIDTDCKSLLNQNCTFKLFNLVGKEVFSVRKSAQSGKVSISLPQLPTGFYTLLIQSADGRLLTKKMIKR